ncbi:hypothetical protein [Arthrobacter cavernae]|uniref:Uncharacterized protein n=1 Tax=Arthrobacter cavernae TaxID=2817681 RepID=A0A939HDT8_9MICC|nr:hypothetical protein [Arthrobacter cavernae]MBO1268011.1 hypothetical protein [Arthrobacter cavernae]
MTATNHARATAFLRRVGLLAGFLAIVAGIFGMHVMTGTHTVHAPAAVAGASGGAAHAGTAAPDGHPGHQAAPTVDHTQVQGTGVTSAESCSCSGNCTTMPDMSAACVPSAHSGSLAAPLPGTTVLAVNVNAGVASPATVRYSYVPGSPSPGELSISRT